MRDILDKLRQLDEQRAAMLEGAKSEALANAKSAVEVLNELGFDYRLTEGAGSKAKKAPKKRRHKMAGVCSVCEFATDPPHDGRRHKGQETMTAFTDAELQEKGLVKVGDVEPAVADLVPDTEAEIAPAG